MGTRLRPLTENQPKVMLEVGGKKILERTIEQLKAAGIDRLVINLHYRPKIVIDYFGNGGRHGVDIKYSRESELLGTAGAVKKAEDEFKNEREFLIVYGDNIFNVDFRQFIESPQKSPAMVMLFDRNKNAHSGVAGDVAELDKDGRISAFWKGAERPDVPFVNGGVYKVTPAIFKHIPAGTAYDFAREVFPKLLKNHVPLQGFVIHPKHAIFGGDTPESLELTRQYFNQ